MARLFWLCFPGLSFKKRKRRKPQYVDQYHTFRSKTVRRPMQCDVCRQPIYSQGSCCRVCKYICHKTCEPRVYSSCDTPLHYPLQGNDALNAYPSHQPSTQLRKSQTFPAGRGPNDDCHLHVERRDQQRLQHHQLRQRPHTIEMDLTFITERIISMSFPMTGMDDSYRNSLQEVTRMLRTKHGENYMIFNVSERRNDMAQLNQQQLLEFGWPDPLAPPLERLFSICKAVDSWLASDSQHVAVLHCKGGKERTAVAVAAYMHYSNMCASADQALDRFAMKKFYNDKLGGLQTPSHKRYVTYFTGLLSGVIKINNKPLYLHQIVLHGVPNFDYQGGCRLFLKVYQGLKPVFTSGVYTVNSNTRQVAVSLETPIQLRGDILVKAYHRQTRPDGRDVILQCQFHTSAVSEFALTFTKEDLDDSIDDIRFPEDGKLEFKFSSSPDRLYGVRDLSVAVDYSADPIVRSDSFENLESTREENPYDTAYIVIPDSTDGNPYATVAKRKQQLLQQQQPASGNGLCNGGAHTASMDSGISSTTPPHSGQSSSSAATNPSCNNNGSSNHNGHHLSGNAHSAPFRTQVEVHRSHQSSTLDSEEQRKLDELLDGMLAQVETIPDLKVVKRVTYSPDIVTTHPAPALPPPPTSVQQYTNGYSVEELEETPEAERDLPYHARKDSQPFSYLVPGSSPTRSRKFKPGTSTTTKVTLTKHFQRSAEPETELPLPPPPAPDAVRDVQPPPLRPVSPAASVPGQQVTYIYNNDSAYDSDPNPVGRFFNANNNTNGVNGDSAPLNREDPNHWLRRQQEKLKVRQEAKERGDRYPKERQLFSELRSAQSRLPRPPPSSTTGPADSSEEDEDDAEVHSTFDHHRRPLYVNTYTNGYQSSPSSSSQQHQPRHPGTRSASGSRSPPPVPSSSGKPPIYGRGGSAPSSPLIPSREVSRSRYPTWQPTTGPPPTSSNAKPLLRQRSDTSHDRERPFVAVKRAHEQNRPRRAANAPGAGADVLAAIATSPIYQNVSSTFQQQQQHRQLPAQTTPSSRGGNVLDSQSPSSPPRQRRNDGLLTTVPKPAGGDQHQQPRTSSPVSGHLEELELSLQSIAPRRSPPQGGHDVYGTSNWSTTSVMQPQDGSASPVSSSGLGDRPTTPGFPVHPRTPYMNQESTPPPQGLPPKSPTLYRKERSPSPATIQQLRAGLVGAGAEVMPHSGEGGVGGGQSSPTVYFGQSRRSSLVSLSEPAEVISHHPQFVKDTSRFWYKPNISREDAINILKDKPAGTFLVRDSSSFPGAYGMALKVNSLPPNVQNKSGDMSSELVRHFLIEPTSKGVKLKGCSNEPVFGSLSALVYQHSITPFALPCKLILPETDPGSSLDDVDSQVAIQLLIQGAACNVLYLFTLDMESLTGPQAVRVATERLLAAAPLPEPTVVHFKVSAQGITLTDNHRQLFFRRHYPVVTITHCGLDPDDRRWTRPTEDSGLPVTSNRIFGFVARKPTSNTDNQCHLFAELEPEQPASAIANFVTKVLMSVPAALAAKTTVI